MMGAQERLFRQLLQPVRHRHHLDIPYGGKRLPLCDEIAMCPVQQQRGRVIHLMMTIPTLTLAPLVTVAIHKVRAVPRESPAVVQGPHHGYPALGKVFEENLIIDEISMDIV